MDSHPTLWHIGISHYSEKVRWALDYKAVEAERRTPTPGMHIPYVFWLTRGRGFTLPVLELDGRRYVDSTRIIAALEERFPAPALYPADPVERRRALQLEDDFDEMVAPYVRRAAFHEMRQDHEQWADLVQRIAPPGPMSRFRRIGGLYARGFTGLRYGAGADRRAQTARQKVVAGFERLERELNGREYLVGRSFTVADLTAAALLYPVVLPPEGPLRIEPLPEGWERFRTSLSGRPGFKWVERMFARHRRPGTTEPSAGVIWADKR